MNYKLRLSADNILNICSNPTSGEDHLSYGGLTNLLHFTHLTNTDQQPECDLLRSITYNHCPGIVLSICMQPPIKCKKKKWLNTDVVLWWSDVYWKSVGGGWEVPG